MPRLRKTPQQRADDVFRASIMRAMIEQDMENGYIADLAGVAEQTLCRWKRDPGCIPLRKLRKLFDICDMTNSEILGIFGRKSESTEDVINKLVLAYQGRA